MESNQKAEPFWKTLWAVWLAIHFLLFFIVAYPFFLLLLSRKKWYPLAHGLRRIWGRYILFMSGMRCRVEFEEPIPAGRTYVLAPNHASFVDIPAVTVMMPGYFAFMAKAELARVPLFGVFFRTIDIAVNRKKAFDAHRSFKDAGERLQDGVSLCLFPEGTIPDNTPQLGRFKDGPFRLAIEQGVDIIPITLPDNHLRFPVNKFAATPGRMRMFVHRPISTAGLTNSDSDSLKREVFSIIEAKLASYAHNG